MKTNQLATAAIVNGMNTWNRRIADARAKYSWRMADYSGNVYTLRAFVCDTTDGDELEVLYSLACRNTPHATSNLFRGTLPTDPTAFDDPEDFLRGVESTRHVAKTMTRC